MIETGKQLADAATALAKNHKTIYGLGCFGWPMNKANQDRTIASYAYNAKEERVDKLRAADDETFAFDCVGMIKALLWGWNGDKTKTYGGAVYVSNGVPDKSANQVIALCSGVSEDFSRIQVGEAVWMKGHIGIYIGGGLAVECTPRWADGVQITAVHNLGKKQGYNGRYWTSHGQLPWVSYSENYTLQLPMLCKGSMGSFVASVQLLLEHQGCSCGSWGTDGDFGTDTSLAVRTFQASKGLEPDGIVGPKTMAALLGVDSQ